MIENPPRLPDWEQHLANFMAVNRNRPFAWGEWDCILFATAAAAAITGVDKAARFRGRYSTRRGAARALRRLGQGTLLATVDAEFPAKPVGRAIRGDLVWHEGCVGVCMGGSAAFLTDPVLADLHGLPRAGSYVMLPRTLWQKAWGV